MGRLILASFMVIIILLIPVNVVAHDPKNYTILLFEDGPTPESIAAGILVENDTLFIRNHDARENASHRLMVDLDGDGTFGGIDDYATNWLNSSCELNETGIKIDENCNAHEMITLSPSNGFLKGNISITHQVRIEDNIIEYYFYVNFGEDLHTPPTDLPIGAEQITTGDYSSRSPLILLLICSVVGMLLIIPQLTKSNEEE